ncbi:hypothetical protein H5410_013334 [Solanum commersonii]|uniref:Uncharacterized protein n=1 Tax=Solanum commersonii TaxID=4109 RepID=A0A9J6AUK8_SOLCO|nr:hypothetical protein H5410_013334 [Solanum commersonii]
MPWREINRNTHLMTASRYSWHVNLLDGCAILQEAISARLMALLNTIFNKTLRWNLGNSMEHINKNK